jgi:hypothetical protein
MKAEHLGEKARQSSPQTNAFSMWAQNLRMQLIIHRLDFKSEGLHPLICSSTRGATAHIHPKSVADCKAMSSLLSSLLHLFHLGGSAMPANQTVGCFSFVSLIVLLIRWVFINSHFTTKPPTVTMNHNKQETTSSTAPTK